METNYYNENGDYVEIDSRVFSDDFDIADQIVTEQIKAEINSESVSEEDAEMFGY